MWLFTELKRRNVVRVGIAYLASAWLLVQIAETLLPVYELPATLIQPLLIILAIGFPVVLILAWAYEITPGGLKLEKDVDRSSSITHHTGRKLDRAIIVVLAIAIGYFAFDKFLLDPVRDSARDESVAQQTRSDVFLEKFGDSSIIVLPFVNMSDDASNEYFSDGMSEELLNLLAQIPRLRVISRSTAFQFKGKDIDVRAVAEQLDVSHVLEGSVRKAGNRVRITAQLIEARTDTHLWSETFDRDLDDIFKIQDEISVQIVASLQGELQIEDASIPVAIPSKNMLAYESFLRGRHLAAQRTRESVKLATEEFERAIALDSEYAAAHAELAIAYILQRAYSDVDLTRDEVNALAEPHAELALSLRPGLAEAQAAIGYLRWNQRRDNEAITHFEEAIRLNPSYSNAYLWYANLLGNQGRYAAQFSTRALHVQIDPSSIPARANLIFSLVRRHNFEEARKHLRKLQALSDEFYYMTKSQIDLVEHGWASGLSSLLNAYQHDLQQGDMGSSIADLFMAIGLDDEAIAFMDPTNVLLLVRAGKSEEAIEAAKKKLKEIGTESWDQGLGYALASGGDYGEALPWMQQNREIIGVQRVMSSAIGILGPTAWIQAQLALNSDADVGVILDALGADVQRQRAAGCIGDGLYQSTDFDAALLALQSGKREQGFAFLDSAVDQGYFISTNLEFLGFIYDDAAFAPILAKQEAASTRERGKFLSVVCVDNPYSDVWVPLPSTCSDHVTTQ